MPENSVDVTNEENATPIVKIDVDGEADDPLDIGLPPIVGWKILADGTVASVREE